MLEEESVDLVVTSPPFALLRQKTYGNRDQDEYVDWLVSFGPLVKRVLKETGSFVIDLGGGLSAWDSRPFALQFSCTYSHV